MQQSFSGKPRIIIVGGVAGGASCAARARRLSESAEIIKRQRFSIWKRRKCVTLRNSALPKTQLILPE
jgi:hypothetical protein